MPRKKSSKKVKMGKVVRMGAPRMHVYRVLMVGSDRDGLAASRHAQMTSDSSMPDAVLAAMKTVGDACRSGFTPKIITIEHVSDVP